MPYDPGIVYDASPLGRGITGGSKALIEGWVKNREKRDKAEEEELAGGMILDFAKNTKFNGMPLINDEIEAKFRSGSANQKRGIIAGLTQKMTLMMAKQRMENEAAETSARQAQIDQGWARQGIEWADYDVRNRATKIAEKKAEQDYINSLEPSPDIAKRYEDQGLMWIPKAGGGDWVPNPRSPFYQPSLRPATMEGTGETVPGAAVFSNPRTGAASLETLPPTLPQGYPSLAAGVFKSRSGDLFKLHPQTRMPVPLEAGEWQALQEQDPDIYNKIPVWGESAPRPAATPAAPAATATPAPSGLDPNALPPGVREAYKANIPEEVSRITRPLGKLPAWALGAAGAAGPAAVGTLGTAAIWNMIRGTGEPTGAAPTAPSGAVPKGTKAATEQAAAAPKNVRVNQIVTVTHNGEKVRARVVEVDPKNNTFKWVPLR